MEEKRATENRIYVGNLPLSADEEDLKELFSDYEPIKGTEIVRDKFSKMSLGYGFVNFVNKVSLEDSVEEMNNEKFQGRQLKVNKFNSKLRA